MQYFIHGALLKWEVLCRKPLGNWQRAGKKVGMMRSAKAPGTGKLKLATTSHTRADTVHIGRFWIILTKYYAANLPSKALSIFLLSIIPYKTSQMFYFRTLCLQNETFEMSHTKLCTKVWLNRKIRLKSMKLDAIASNCV